MKRLTLTPDDGDFGDALTEGRELPLPAVPTDALPGSPEKMAVMLRRAARGESVFHPADATGSYVPQRPASRLPNIRSLDRAG